MKYVEFKPNVKKSQERIDKLVERVFNAMNTLVESGYTEGWLNLNYSITANEVQVALDLIPKYSNIRVITYKHNGKSCDEAYLKSIYVKLWTTP